MTTTIWDPTDAAVDAGDADTRDDAPYLCRAMLTDGLEVAVRPLRHDDRAELAAGFRRLSEESRFRRFMTGKPRLTARDLDLLVDGVDQDHHIAVALALPRGSHAEVGLGVAHAFRLTRDPQTADVAVTVVDEIQGRGAGRLLMRVLADAAMNRGITRFTAVMLPCNTASARLLAGVGIVEVDRISDGVRELTVRLTPRADLPADGAATHPVDRARTRASARPATRGTPRRAACDAPGTASLPKRITRRGPSRVLAESRATRA